MKFKVLIIDALLFATSNWYNLIILGIILFLLENLYNLPGNPPGIDLYDITGFIIIGYLWILESGYIFRILEETINRSKKPPKFNNIKELLSHGLNENIVLFAYLLIPLFLVGLIIHDAKILLKILEMNTSIIFYYLGSSNKFYFITLSILAIIIYYGYLGALLNMAHHNGNLRSGFNAKEIILRIKKVGIRNLLAVYVLIIFVVIILLYTLSTTLEMIPLNIYNWNIGDIITQLLIAPYLLIFAFRMLGLLNQNERDHETG